MSFQQILRAHDSVLLGNMHGPEDTIKQWNDQMSTLKVCHLQGLEQIEFEWKISQEPQNWTFSAKFMQICKENTSHLNLVLFEIKEHASKFNEGHWAFLGSG